MNIILCGLPMSGKTTLGLQLAKHLHLNFIDTDRLIENAFAAIHKSRLTCRQIFQQEGSSVFREFEKLQIASLIHKKDTVIAVGGGALVDPENVKILKQLGCLVYLKTPMNILWERIKQNGIPGYLDATNPEEAFYVLVKQRTPIYETHADITILCEF